MYLLDTNTVSEFRKLLMRRGDPQVTAWAATTKLEQYYVSAISIQEIELGVLLAERKDVRKGAILRAFMAQYVLHHFRDRILPVDERVALRSAQLHAQRTRGISDALIAATAYIHNLSVVTRNIRDFEETGVDIINPWKHP